MSQRRKENLRKKGRGEDIGKTDHSQNMNVKRYVQFMEWKKRLPRERVDGISDACRKWAIRRTGEMAAMLARTFEHCSSDIPDTIAVIALCNLANGEGDCSFEERCDIIQEMLVECLRSKGIRI